MSKSITKSLEFLMKRRNYASFKEISRAIGLHPSTLSSYIRKMSEDRSLSTVPESFTERLCKVLDIDREYLSMILVMEHPKDLHAIRHLIEQQINTYKPLNETYISEILDLTSRLYRGDIYTLITCFTPLEHNDLELQERIAEAILKGVTFRYIFPKDEENYKSSIERYLTEDTRNCFLLPIWHKERLVDNLRKRGIEDEILKLRVKSYTDDDPILVSPINKYIHITRSLLGAEDTAVFGEVRVGTIHGSSVMRYWHPLPRSHAQSIDRKVKEVCSR